MRRASSVRSSRKRSDAATIRKLKGLRSVTLRSPFNFSSRCPLCNPVRRRMRSGRLRQPSAHAITVRRHRPEKDDRRPIRPKRADSGPGSLLHLLRPVGGLVLAFGHHIQFIADERLPQRRQTVGKDHPFDMVVLVLHGTGRPPFERLLVFVEMLVEIPDGGR